MMDNMMQGGMGQGDDDYKDAKIKALEDLIEYARSLMGKDEIAEESDDMAEIEDDDMPIGDEMGMDEEMSMDEEMGMDEDPEDELGDEISQFMQNKPKPDSGKSMTIVAAMKKAGKNGKPPKKKRRKG